MILELTRKKTSSETDFLAELSSLGLELIHNYEALPRNYSCRLTGRSPEEVLKKTIHIASWEDGDSTIARGADFTLIDTPLNKNFIGDVPTQGRGGVPYTPRLGRNWGVLFTTSSSPSSPPFNAVIPGQYNFDFLSNGNGTDFYIIDTGVDVDHPEFDEDLYGSRVISLYETYYNATDDDHGHGSHMASCGAGKTMGMATNTRIFSAKGLDGTATGNLHGTMGATNALVARFIAEAGTGRPGVMNNSRATSEISTAYTTAVDAAVDAGMVMVASAGNDSIDLSSTNDDAFPAEYDDVLAIGSIDMSYTRSSFSNYGTALDMFSPGRGILGGVRGGEMGWINGTSPACALASAIVCCLLQGYKRPSNRADVLAVYNHVKNLAVSGLVKDRINDATTDKMVHIGPGDNTTKARIPGLTNLLSTRNNIIRPASLGRSITTGPYIGPGRQQRIAPILSDEVQDLVVALPTPTISSTALVSNIAPWQSQNHDLIDANVSLASIRRLFHSFDVSAETDIEDEDIGPPPGRTGDFAFRGSRLGVFARMYQIVPLRAVPESNPVHFSEFFSNLNWESGDFTNWTAGGSGTARLATSNSPLYPQAGAYMYEPQRGDTSVTNTADLPSSINLNVVDAGNMYMAFECYTGNSYVDTVNDEARVRVLALNSSSAVISTIFDTGVVERTTIGWDARMRADMVLPALTRKLQIIVDGFLRDGFTVNAPVSSLQGLVYEKTNEGDRVIEMVGSGLARWETRYIARNVDYKNTHHSDNSDEGGAQIVFIDANGTEGPLDQEGMSSTFRWTTRYHRINIPENTRMARLYIRGHRVSGVGVQWFCRDISAKIRMGQQHRALGSIARMFSRGQQPTVSNVGGQAGVVVTSAS